MKKVLPNKSDIPFNQLLDEAFILKQVFQNKNNIPFNQLPDEAFIRLKQLIQQGLVLWSAETHWRKCRKGGFPEPIKISAGITAWRVGSIRNWLADPTSYLSARDKETKKIGRRKVAA